jgi:SAM-dependent methyltransferase
MYADHLREMFPELDPVVDDLFLLEAHQIAQLPDRAPHRELALVLDGQPRLLRFLAARYPPIEPFLTQVVEEHAPSGSDIAQVEEDLVWELADLIVYQRAPALYDAKVSRRWTFDALEEVEPLDGKVIIDAGAGTGQVTFAVAPAALMVFAVEPVATLRAYMRDKARNEGLANVFVLDGVLDAIPLPAESADVLLTRNAIGWALDSELVEIERVVRPGGKALHLARMPYPAEEDAPHHAGLLAAGYEERPYRDGEVQNRKYYKQI